MNRIRLGLFDHFPLIREGFPRLLGDYSPQIEIAATGLPESAWGSDRSHDGLDVLVSDIPRADVSASSVDTQEVISPKLIVYSDFSISGNLQRACALRPSGLVSKREPVAQLIENIQALCLGVHCRDADFARLAKFHQIGEVGVATSGKERLTARELEVLCCVGNGLGRTAIAKKLMISVRTVDRHRQNIMDKLGIHREIELAHFAFRHQLDKL